MNDDEKSSSETVTLRTVGDDDLSLLDQWYSDLEHQSTYGDFIITHRRRGNSQRSWDVDGLVSEDTGTLLICVDETPVGAVEWHPIRYGPNRGSQAFNIGIAIAPSARGRGVGSRAQRLVADFLFAHTTVHRIEAGTDVTNLGEQTALERAGYQREGVLRGAQFRLGEWHDLVVYSRLRTDT